MDHLKDKVVVVSGAGGGFGRLIAELASSRGAKIVGGDIDADGLRRGEIAGLRWTNVDLKAKTVRIVDANPSQCHELSQHARNSRRGTAPRHAARRASSWLWA
jgi:NAD(P)-dependent dehydrogenase (short-subunit alcohol dehydrogenase family)